jgi:hypothetical protein
MSDSILNMVEVIVKFIGLATELFIIFLCIAHLMDKNCMAAYAKAALEGK